MSSPTRIVLSSMRQHGVRYLLMGGQACIIYGAAEFSRDTDIAIPPSSRTIWHAATPFTLNAASDPRQRACG